MQTKVRAGCADPASPISNEQQSGPLFNRREWPNIQPALTKLHPVSSKPNLLILELELPKAISVQALWWAGLGEVQRFLLALNIGTLGFFWFSMPERVSRYYESLVDLETDTALTVDRTPALRIDWGSNTLSSEELNRVALCVGSIPGGPHREQHGPFDHYLTGLGYLAKTDVIMQFEGGAFVQFYSALKEAAQLYGYWDGSGQFSDQLPTVLAPLVKKDASLDPYLEAASRVDAGRSTELSVDLGEVAMLKRLTDLFLLREFQRRMPHDDQADRADD